jgi:sugar/nucleoside kinase (ribokinase family)
VNDYEIGAVADIDTRDGERTLIARVTDALKSVFSFGPLSLAVAHFPEGAIAVTRAGDIFAVGSAAIPDEAIIGVNGAGDAFAAGVLYGWHEGRPIEEALRLGHACAGASMRSAATTSMVVSAKDCLALAEQWGYRPIPI